jgi:CRISPR-associated protein Cas2
MHVVICYDIVCDRRRGRLLRKLRESLVRVQKSVFEGEIADERLVVLREKILDEIDLTKDTVRIYHLCARCRPATELVGVSTFVDTDDADEIV